MSKILYYDAFNFVLFAQDGSDYLKSVVLPQYLGFFFFSFFEDVIGIFMKNSLSMFVIMVT